MDQTQHGPGEDTPSETAKAPINNSSETIPDPDEDDLDDLDGKLGELRSLTTLTSLIDLLDEFSTAKQPETQNDTSSLHSNQLRDQKSDLNGPDDPSADFSKQLQEQMAALMGNVDDSPEMKRELQAMMEELMLAGEEDGAAAPSKESKTAVPSNVERPFQATIQETIERLQASEEHASAAAISEESDDILAQMLKEMQNANLEGAGDEEDFSTMLMGMMEQLTNKDILMEPMKELHDMFPEWMARNKSLVKADDLKRYEEQQRLVGEIVGKFNDKTYSDSNPDDRRYIVTRMQQVCHWTTFITMIKLIKCVADAGGRQSTSRSCRRYECYTRSFRGVELRMRSAIK